MFRNKRITIVLVLVYIGTLINFYYPMIRFSYAYNNLVFTVIVLLIPMVLFLQSFRLKNLVMKIVSVLSLGGVSLASLILILVVALKISMLSTDGYDPSFENLRALQVDEYKVTAYRINGGATTAYSMVVRQEKNLGLGLMMVKELYSQYRKGDVELDWKDHVLFIDGEAYPLMKNIYFE